MASIEQRIAALEMAQQGCAGDNVQLLADIHTARNWWIANNRAKDIQPPDSFTDGERVALDAVRSVWELV